MRVGALRGVETVFGFGCIGSVSHFAGRIILETDRYGWSEAGEAGLVDSFCMNRS